MAKNRNMAAKNAKLKKIRCAEGIRASYNELLEEPKWKKPSSVIFAMENKYMAKYTEEEEKRKELLAWYASLKGNS